MKRELNTQAPKKRREKQKRVREKPSFECRWNDCLVCYSESSGRQETRSTPVQKKGTSTRSSVGKKIAATTGQSEDTRSKIADGHSFLSPFLPLHWLSFPIERRAFTICSSSRKTKTRRKKREWVTGGRQVTSDERRERERRLVWFAAPGKRPPNCRPEACVAGDKTTETEEKKYCSLSSPRAMRKQGEGDGSSGHKVPSRSLESKNVIRFGIHEAKVHWQVELKNRTAWNWILGTKWMNPHCLLIIRIRNKQIYIQKAGCNTPWKWCPVRMW